MSKNYLMLSGVFLNTLVTAGKVQKNYIPGERVITLEEVSRHDQASDCWIILYDRVYDISSFLDEHPGGRDLLLEYAGGEASGAFRGSGHSAQAVRTLKRFCIGELPMHERIFRKPGGYKLSGIPE